MYTALATTDITVQNRQKNVRQKLFTEKFIDTRSVLSAAAFSTDGDSPATNRSKFIFVIFKIIFQFEIFKI